MFIFVIGLEGCGHHGLSAVVKRSLKNASKTSRFTVKEMRSIRQSLLPEIFGESVVQQLKENIAATSLLYKEVDCLYEDTSFPADKRRKIQQQYKISDEYFYFAKIGKLKVIHLKRNMYNTINSHPRWDGGIIKHARVLNQIETKVIQSGLCDLKSRGGQIVELEYEKINTEEGIDIITNILEIDRIHVIDAVNEVFKPSTKDYQQLISPEKIELIQRILNY